jgi:hypothetical protein
MKINRTVGVILVTGYFLIVLLYFYFNNDIPLEITSGWLKNTITFSFLFTPFLVGVLVGYLIPEKWQENKAIAGIVHIFFFSLTVHNIIWTFIMLMFSGGYEDQQISFPDPGDQRHKIIMQHRDNGIFGEYYREIEVYELTPFLRYVYREDYY